MYQFKINQTNSLHTARYFIAHGINLFGFTLDALEANHVSIDKLNDIQKWLYQPIVMLEIANHQSADEIAFLKEKTNAQLIQTNYNHPEFDSISKNYNDIIIQIDTQNISQLENIQQNSNIIININSNNYIDLIKNYKFILDKFNVYINAIDFDVLKSTLQHIQPYGICIPNLPNQEDDIPYELYEKYLDLDA